MSKKISFDELLAKREQREADKLRIGMLAIPGSDKGLDVRMPPKSVVLELYGEMVAAEDPIAMLECGNHALYCCCPQLQERELHEQLGVADDPIQAVDALFSVSDQDILGGRALQFLGLLPTPQKSSENGNDGKPTSGETVKN